MHRGTCPRVAGTVNTAQFRHDAAAARRATDVRDHRAEKGWSREGAWFFHADLAGADFAGAGGGIAKTGTGTLTLTGHASTGAGSAPIQATGSVHLGGALNVNAAAASGLAPGEKITFVRNMSDQPVVGTFAGLGEGAMLSGAGSGTYRISFVGGAGHDVVLTVVAAPNQSAAASSRNGGGSGASAQSSSAADHAGFSMSAILATAAAAIAVLAGLSGLAFVLLLRRRRPARTSREIS